MSSRINAAAKRCSHGHLRSFALFESSQRTLCLTTHELSTVYKERTPCLPIVESTSYFPEFCSGIASPAAILWGVARAVPIRGEGGGRDYLQLRTHPGSCAPLIRYESQLKCLDLCSTNLTRATRPDLFVDAPGVNGATTSSRDTWPCLNFALRLTTPRIESYTCFRV